MRGPPHRHAICSVERIQGQTLCGPLFFGRCIVRRLLFSSFLALSASLAPAAVSLAQTPLADREPGLWELRLVEGSRLASMALGMEQALKNLPESQRKQMQQMLGGAGVALPTVIRQCLTPEMARRDIKPQLAEHDIQCSELQWKEAAGTGQFSFVCTNPQGEWSGNGRIWDATPKHFMSEASVKGTYKGQPVEFDMKHEAKWLGSDCKGVKPAN